MLGFIPTHKCILTQQDVNYMQNEGVCVEWCILNRCQINLNTKSGNSSPASTSCIHGKHSQSIHEMIYKSNNYPKAWKWLQYFETDLSCDKIQLLSAVYHHLAQICMIYNEYQLADEYFDKASKINPNDCTCLLNQAQMLYKHNPLSNSQLKSCQILKQVIQLEPNKAKHNYLFAVSLANDLNNIEEKLYYLDKAIKLQENNPIYHFEFGCTLFEKSIKCHKIARRAFQKTVTLVNKMNNISGTNQNDPLISVNSKFAIQNNSATISKQLQETNSKDDSNANNKDLSYLTRRATNMINKIDKIKHVINTTTMIDIKDIKLNHHSIEWVKWKVDATRINKPIHDHITLGSVDSGVITQENYDNLMNQLINCGYNDKILNDFKLKIYNFDIDLVKKYYHSDRFCHNMCIFGYCLKMNDGCSYIHCLSTDKMVNCKNYISINQVKKAILFTNYIVYIYKYVSILKDKETDHYKHIISSVNERFGDIYRVIAQNTNDFIKAEQFYDRAAPLCNKWCDLALKHAKLLDCGLHDWTKAESLFKSLLNAKNTGEQNGYRYYRYGKALVGNGFDDRAIQQFKKAIERKPDNAAYYEQYAMCLFRKGKSYYDEGLQLFKYVLTITDSKGKDSYGYPNSIRNNAIQKIDEIERLLRSRTCNNNNNDSVDQGKDTDTINIATSKSVKMKDHCNQDEKNNCKNCNEIRINRRSPIKQSMIKEKTTYDASDAQQRMFNKFWNGLECVNNALKWKKYYDKLCIKEYNCLSMVPFLNEKILLNEIEMNQSDCDKILKEIRKFKLQSDKFINWLKHNELYNLYLIQFNKHGIYTLKSLEIFIDHHPNDWAYITMKNAATNDCFILDAKIICKLLKKTYS